MYKKGLKYTIVIILGFILQSQILSIDPENFVIDSKTRIYLNEANELLNAQGFDAAGKILLSQAKPQKITGQISEFPNYYETEFDGLAYYYLESLRNGFWGNIGSYCGHYYHIKLLENSYYYRICEFAVDCMSDINNNKNSAGHSEVSFKTLLKLSQPPFEHPLAQYMLAVIFYNGISINRDLNLAEYWATKSLEKYYIPAANLLANISLDSNDFEKASQYCKIALGQTDSLIPPYFQANVTVARINFYLELIKKKLDLKPICCFTNEDIVNYFRFYLINKNKGSIEKKVIAQFKWLFKETQSPYCAALLCYMLKGTKELFKDTKNLKKTVVVNIENAKPDLVDILAKIDFRNILTIRWADEDLLNEFDGLMKQYMAQYNSRF